MLRERVLDLEAAREVDDTTASLLAPLRDTIGRVERQVGALERDRSQQFGQLGESLTEVSRSTESLRSETATLATALNARRCAARGARCSCGACSSSPGCSRAATSTSR